VGHAPHHHPRALLRGYRVHTLLCRGSGLPLLFLLSPANCHDAPFARPLLTWAVRLYGLRPRVVRLDTGYWGAASDCLDSHEPTRRRRRALEPQATEEPLLLAAYLDSARAGQTELHRAFLRSRLQLVWPRTLAAPSADGLVRRR
jgi:hypothetical protein